MPDTDQDDAPRQRVCRPCLVLLLVTLLAGCTTTPIPPPYTADELGAKCIRTGGWWRPDIVGGYCEYEGPMP